MSEDHFVVCKRIGRHEVCRSSDGWAEIEPNEQGIATGPRITIPAEDVPTVALALLGGITNEMIERAADAIERRHQQDIVDWGVPAEEFARVALEAAFGQGDGG